MRTLRALVVLVIAGLLLGSPIVALASDISQATEYGNIRVSNNGTAATNVATVMTLSSSDLISQGWLDSSFTRMAIRNASGADVPFMPSINASIPWSLWVPSIGATSQLNYILYTGPANMGATKYYFPGASGMSVADNASLEPSANFSQTYQGYFDMTATGSDGIIATKPNAYKLFRSPSVSGNVTAEIYAGGSSANQTQTTNGVGDETSGSITITGAATQWEAVQTNDGDTSYINTASTSTVYSSYALTDFSIPESNVFSVDSVQVTFRIRANGVLGYFTPGLRLYGNNSLGSTQSHSSTSYTTYTQTISRPGGGNWQYSDLAPLQVRVGLAIDTSGAIITTYVGVIIHYTQLITASSVSATGVSSGEHSIVVTSNATSLGIQVDGGSWTTTSPAVVPDNSNNWALAQNNVMPYVQSINMSVGGNLKGSWQWQYATTFTDQSSNGNTATPSFQTSSSSANVSANLSSFQPIATARAPAFAVTEAPAFITANITATSNFTSANVTGSQFPGSDVVDASAAAAGVPNIWLWGILGGITIALGGLGVSYMERRFGTGNGTLLLRILVGVLIFGLMITFGKFDFWMLVIYLFIVIAPAMASRQFEVGASPGELNFIGFLAMTWIGLTGINRIIQGQLLTSAETTHLNTLMFTQQFTLLDMFSMPILNFKFFSEGIPALLRWDYAMFGGNAQIIQYLLYSLTAVMTMIILGFLAGTLTSYFSRLR